MVETEGAEYETRAERPQRANGENSGPLVVEEKELQVVVDEQGRETETERVRYRILDERAFEMLSSVSVSWAPWRAERPVLRARITTPDGERTELDPKTISEAPERRTAPNMFSDRRILRAPLPKLTVGSVVEVEHIIRATSPTLSPGIFGRQYFAAPIPTEVARLVLDVPADAPLAFRARALSIEPKVTLEAGRRRLVFERGPLDPIAMPDFFSPSDEPGFPQVVFSTHASWNDLARRYAEIVDSKIAGVDLSALVARARKEKTTLGAAKILARVLHERVRYTGLELGEAALIPSSPTDTLAHGYGDCKDKAVLLVAMLRAVGIKSEVALLDAGFGPDVDLELPGIEPFNHVIVHVPGHPDLWIDATFDGGAIGTLPVEVQGRLALIADRETKSLTRIPAATQDQNIYEEGRDVYLAESGGARIVETTSATGFIETRLRKNWGAPNQEEWLETIAKYVRDNYDSRKIVKAERFNTDDVQERLRVRLEIDEANDIYTDDRSASVDFAPAALFEWLPDSLRNKDSGVPRRSDFVWPTPYTAEIRYHVIPRPGFALRALPESGERALGPAVVSARFRVLEDQTLSAVFRFDVKKTRYSAAEFATFRRELDKFRGSKKQTAVFDHIASKLIRNGDIAGGLALNREAIGKDPRNPFHHVHMCEALLDAGFGDESRKEGRIAVSLGPNDLGYFRLGRALMHDSLGRKFHSGADLHAALDVFKKAKELFPRHASVRDNIAAILVRNEKLEKYGDGARLQAALDEYRGLSEDLGEHDYDIKILETLFHMQRFQEVLASAKSLPQNTDHDPLLVAAAAALTGKIAALQLLEELGVEAKAKAKVLIDAANLLLFARKYSLAAELFSAAAPAGDSPIELQTKIDILAKTKPVEEIAKRANRPGRAVLRILRAMWAGRDQYLKELSEAGRAEHDASKAFSSGEAEALRTSGAVRYHFQLNTEDGNNELIAMDLVASNIVFEVEGSEVEGYLVRTRTPSLADTPVQEWMLISEHGELMLRTFSSNAAAMAAEAFARANRGDIRTAEKWMGWIKEPIDGDELVRKVASIEPENKAATLKNKAAVLMSRDAATAAAAVPVLEKLHREHPDWPQLTRALITALRLGKRLDEAAKRALAEYREAPEDRGLLQEVVTTLLDARRPAEALGLCEKWLVAHASDREARALAARAAQAMGDYRKADTFYRALIEQDSSDAQMLNLYAWNVVLLGGPYERGLEAALRSVQQSQFREPAALNTLATLYAEAGKPNEAQKALLASLDASSSDPGPYDWYVIGRIAESYALTDAAKAAYEKALSDKSEADLVFMTERRLRAGRIQ